MSSNLGFHRLNWACLLMVLLVGCGKSATPRTEVVGEISLDGKPVANAQVYLSAKRVDKKTQGTFGAFVVDGSFGFNKADGPPPGSYDVIVNPAEEDSEEVFERIREQKKKALLNRENFVSAVARKGPMKVELSSDKVNSIKIELTSR